MNVKLQMTRIFVFVAILLFLTISISNAQILTGSVKGTVTDEEGVPLPGVTVEISSPVLLGGIHTQITSDRGLYRFVNLPPGMYKLVFKLDNFQTFERLQVKVKVNITITENIVLKQAAIEESITVVGESPVVDVTRSGFSSNFDRDQIEKVPGGRHSVFDLAKQAPGIIIGAAYENAPSIIGLGADEDSNSIQLDGLDISNPRLGVPILFPSQDLMTEVEILTAGAPAEYGHYTGVVVNVVSKSGGNDFSGSLSYYGQFDALTSDNNPDTAAFFSYKRHTYFDLSGTFGGPIIKDRLWFFGAANLKKDDQTYWQSDPQYHTQEKENFYFFKLSGQIGSDHRVTGVFSYRDWGITEVPDPWNTPETTRAKDRQIPNWNLQYTWLMSQNAFFSFKIAGFDDSRDRLPNPEFGATLQDPVHLDLASGVFSGGAIYPYLGKHYRFQAHGNLSYFAEDFLGGDHDFKFGVQFNRGGHRQICDYAGDRLYLDWQGQNYLMYQHVAIRYGGESDHISAFLDDSWSIGDRLTINLGFRYDDIRGDITEENVWENWEPTNDVYPAIPNLVVWKNFSPRLGLVYQLTADGKTILKAHYGRYVQFLSPGIYNSPGPYNQDWFAYFWDGANWVNYVSIPGNLDWGMDPNLKAPYANLFTLGFERELIPDLSVGVQGIYRKENDLIAVWNYLSEYEQVQLVSPDNGQTYNVWNQTNLGVYGLRTTNPPGFEYEYRAIVFNLNKRFSHKWLLNASLTYSRAEGLSANNVAATGIQSGIIAHISRYTGKDRNDYTNAEGLLINDRPWHLKVQFAYTLPWDFLFGLHYQFMSGSAYLSYVRVFPDQGMRTIIAEPRNNDARHPNINLLDVRLEKRVRIQDRFSLSAIIDVFNLLNLDTVTGYANYNVFSSAYLSSASMLPPRQIQLGIKLQF